MKIRNLIFTTVSFISLSSFAQASDVAYYRHLFAGAKSPNLEEITGKTYDCRGIRLESGDATQEIHYKYHFYESDTGLLNSAKKSGLLYLPTNSGLSAEKKMRRHSSGYDVIRMSAEGNLVVEWSVHAPKRLRLSSISVETADPAFNTVIPVEWEAEKPTSIAVEGALAHEYLLCSPAEPKKY